MIVWLTKAVRLGVSTDCDNDNPDAAGRSIAVASQWKRCFFGFEGIRDVHDESAAGFMVWPSVTPNPFDVCIEYMASTARCTMQDVSRSCAGRKTCFKDLTRMRRGAEVEEGSQVPCDNSGNELRCAAMCCRKAVGCSLRLLYVWCAVRCAGRKRTRYSSSNRVFGYRAPHK